MIFGRNNVLASLIDQAKDRDFAGAHCDVTEGNCSSVTTKEVGFLPPRSDTDGAAGIAVTPSCAVGVWNEQLAMDATSKDQQAYQGKQADHV
jgi:hypothetical protein